MFSLFSPFESQFFYQFNWDLKLIQRVPICYRFYTVCVCVCVFVCVCVCVCVCV